MNIRTTLIAFILTACAGSSLHAQNNSAYLVKEWERAKAYTRAYLDAMPDSGYALKPTPDMRSFAEQMLHLSDGNYLLGSQAVGVKSPYQQGELEKSTDKSKAQVTKMVLASYDFIIDGLNKMPAGKLTEKFKLFDKFDLTHEQVLAKTFEHQTHHRGQTTVYLRLAGVKPPQEMLF